MGNGSYNFSGDGAAARSANLSAPRGVVVDSKGSLYIADANNRRVRRITPDGTIAKVAGNGSFVSYSDTGDGGPATNAPLAGPWGVAVDGSGNLFIGDTANSTVRKVTPSGIISTVIGGGLTVAVDGNNDLFTSDVQTVYEVTPAGMATKFAGGAIVQSSATVDPPPVLHSFTVRPCRRHDRRSIYCRCVSQPNTESDTGR